ncbi:conserved protein of unknown function [Rhodovastum atsumiense]|uniref:Uncharacterized protein n=1 Tax=Rhodovastum atsumiense TaxID=504468 RepID=A0A5M6IJW7_9PROT|nr:hypothetical protein [Rhodovastum atsumiense]KAA5607975.1 hypothetical protein F1189_31310 [Rhodovastum atsumiense]CAH2599055.1 conserved protein of unknown function [Rhodovastum atsumiense]
MRLAAGRGVASITRYALQLYSISYILRANPDPGRDLCLLLNDHPIWHGSDPDGTAPRPKSRLIIFNLGEFEFTGAARLTLRKTTSGDTVHVDTRWITTTDESSGGFDLAYNLQGDEVYNIYFNVIWHEFGTKWAR